MQTPKIGIRPVIDGRRPAGVEEKAWEMARLAKELIESSLRYMDGTPVECVVSPVLIGGSREAAICAEAFSTENVCATLSVTPCWCFGSETMDMDPMTIKAVWGFNATGRPGAVYLAAVMAAHAQMKLPAFSIYGADVQDETDDFITEDVKEKILQFAKCAIAVGEMRGKCYVNIGAVSMGIAGSICDPEFFRSYLGIRSEWVDMTEVLRRIRDEIYDVEEYERALSWIKENCREGWDMNPEPHTPEQKAKEWETIAKLTLICRDIMLGNPNLTEKGYIEEGHGRNAIAAGFQGQRMWSDWQPNADFTEAILNTPFDWNGIRPSITFATENDTLNAVSMLFSNLITRQSSAFADVRTFWSPDAIERVTGKRPTGYAKDGIIHLINSGSAALDASGVCKNEKGEAVMKKWWDMTQEDVQACLDATEWCPADLVSFNGGGFSSHFVTDAEMPVTMLRVNLVAGLGPVLQIAEGYTCVLEKDMHDLLEQRTNPTWPTTWFAPRLTGEGAFRDVYSVMANWGANHGCFTYGHIGKDLITLASMLRIPVAMHNVPDKDVYRPHVWAAFGTKNLESADYRACEVYGPLYR
ncbi:MAG: L-fucose isomerase [Christensenellaceae bacterium]|nr:L-fucose isomerase [Christensenellaceae bacterium]